MTKSTYRFLIVDDSPTICNLVASELRQRYPACEIVTVSSPDELTKALLLGPYTVAIADYQLHWSNGIEIAKELKARYPGNPVIMYTGSGSEEVAVQALRTYLDDYILKTAQSLTHLMTAVQRLIDNLTIRRAVEETEVRYRHLFENLPIGVYRITPDGFILDANRKLIEMLRCPNRESILAANASDILFGSQDRRLLSNLDFEKQRVYHIETEIRRYDGAPLWVHHYLHAVYNGAGDVVYFQGAVEDITSRKQAELAFKESLHLIQRAKQEWEATVDSLPQVVALLDVDGRVLRVNRTATQWKLGHIRSFSGRHLHEVLHPHCEEEECYLDAFLPDAFQRLLDDRPSELEVHDRQLKRYLHLHVHPINVETLRNEVPNSSFAALIITDITHSKQSEASLRRYIERLDILHQIDRSILSARSPERIAANALRWVQRVVPFDIASVIELMAGEEQAMELAHLAEGDVYINHPTRLTGQAETIMHFFERQEVFEVRHALGMESPPHLVASLEGKKLGMYVYFPLVARDELIGGLLIGRKSVSPLNLEERETITQVANQIAVAIRSARLFERVNQARARLQRLSQSLVDAQEKERHFIAGELHDEIGQALTAAKLQIQAGMAQQNEAEITRHLTQALEIVDQTLQTVRTMSLNLRPPMLDDLGLVAALRWFVDQQNKQGGLEVTLQVEPPDLSLPDDLEITCFRLVQEAITNTRRHAEATRSVVHLQRNANEVILHIQDNGKGMDVEAALKSTGKTSLGLLNMQERVYLMGGKIHFVSRPDKGLEILARFPVERGKTSLPQTDTLKPPRWKVQTLETKDTGDFT